MNELHRQIVPAGRMQAALEVARFVALLDRDEAERMNGAIVDLTGGRRSL